MDEEQLRVWLKNPNDYQKGILFLVELGGDKHSIELCRKYDNSFTRAKLFNAISDLYGKLQKTKVESTPVAAPAVDFFDMPKELQALEREKGKMFREIFPFRNQLKEIFDAQLKRAIKSKARLTVAQACDLMKQTDKAKKPVPFSVSFVTFNRLAGTGGELIHFEHATLVMPNKGGSKTYNATDYDLLVHRDPNHWKNSTRNIRPLASHEIRKLHIWLMFEFNGMEVTINDPG